MDERRRLDRIEVNELVVVTTVGVLPHERQIAQPVRLDLVLHADLRDAGRSDDLADTADYGDIAQRVAALVRASEDELLERLADRVAELLVAIHRVDSVEVTVTKLRPPIAAVVSSTAVHVERNAGDYVA